MADQKKQLDLDTQRQESPEGSVSNTRRKLLKAAAVSAPLVSSLKSGSAFAMTSVIQCIGMDHNNPPNYNVTSGYYSNDGWMRQQVKRYRYKKSNGYWTPWLYHLDSNFNTATKTGTLYKHNTDPSRRAKNVSFGNKQYEAEDVSVLVLFPTYVDSYGNRVLSNPNPSYDAKLYPQFMLSDNHVDMTAITHSCLTSVAP